MPFLVAVSPPDFRILDPTNPLNPILTYLNEPTMGDLIKLIDSGKQIFHLEYLTPVVKKSKFGAGTNGSFSDI